MKQFQTVYLPCGVGTFHMPSAHKAFEDSIALLKSLDPEVRVPAEPLLSIDLLKAFLAECDPDLVIFQNLTFANGAYMSEVLHATKAPVLLWTLREPAIDGGRLRLNSLTGAFSAATAVKAFREEPFEYVYGAPEEAQVKKTIKAMMAAAKLKYDMRQLKLAAIGQTPEGFGFGRALDLEMLKQFGVHLVSLEARELIDKAKSFSDEECKAYLDDALGRTVGLEATPERNRLDFARLYKAYDEFVKNNQIGAIASRCWPDFFVSYGTPVCAVLAMINDLGVAAACETDAYGALSMWAGMKLSGKPVFFGDPVSLNEQDNTLYFWHCGTAACSLARKDTGAVIGEHCNRHIGPTLEFGCKPSPEATVFRIGRTPEGKFRFLLAQGEILDMPQQFLGTSMVVRMNNDAKRMVYDAVKKGFEPHYVVIYGHYADQLEMLGHMLNMEVVRY